VVGCTGTVNGLQVVNSSTGPDELTLVHAMGGMFTSIRDVDEYDVNDTDFVVLDADELHGGVVGQDFDVDDYVILSDLDVGAIVKITGVTPSGTPLGSTYDIEAAQVPSACATPAVFPGAGFKTSDLVIRARFATFFVDDTGDVPVLMMDPDGPGAEEAEPVAEGVEDMQIAIGVDADADGAVSEVGGAADDDEWHFNVAGDAAPNPALTPRAVRITLIARSPSEQSEVATYTRPAAEDHAEGTQPDPFRRRVLTTTVEIRNLAGSP
jgi:hypothetical protein